jgi:hypothetical protein
MSVAAIAVSLVALLFSAISLAISFVANRRDADRRRDERRGLLRLTIPRAYRFEVSGDAADGRVRVHPPVPFTNDLSRVAGVRRVAGSREGSRE